MSYKIVIISRQLAGDELRI